MDSKGRRTLKIEKTTTNGPNRLITFFKFVMQSLSSNFEFTAVLSKSNFGRKVLVLSTRLVSGKLLRKH